MEMRLPNKPENITKAYNLARFSEDEKLQVEITEEWVIIKSATNAADPPEKAEN